MQRELRHGWHDADWFTPPHQSNEDTQEFGIVGSRVYHSKTWWRKTTLALAALTSVVAGVSIVVMALI